MAACWYKWRRRGVRYLFVASLLYLTFLITGAFTATTPRAGSSSGRHYIVEQTEQAVMAHIGTMKSTLFALASSVLVASQNTSDGTPTTNNEITATVNGVTTAFSNAFTVPASADIGPNLLPNIKDPQAVQAQDVCPGYTAGEVEKTAHGFTAILSLAGQPVRDLLKAHIPVSLDLLMEMKLKTLRVSRRNQQMLTECSATSTALTLSTSI
jgi:hypothetical protein